MKPFDLTKFLAGEPAITRDGRKVIDWHYFKDSLGKYKLAVLLEGYNTPICYNDIGELNLGLEDDFDLFMEEKEVDLWINITKNRDGSYSSNVFRSESNANLHKQINSKCNMSTHKITIKE